MEIVTQYSLWWMLLVVLLSLVLSALLYYKNPRDHFPIWVNIILGVFRFTIFSLLGFLLLNPMLKSWKTEIQKPIILVLQDDSRSITMNADSSDYKTEYPKQMEGLIAQLQEKYEVKTFSFSEKIKSGVKYEFNGVATNIAAALSSVHEQYGHLNIGAVVMATDGIYNRGQNPYYASQKLKFPIYFIALGDTLVKSDLIINHLAYNRTVFLSNKFPIEVEVIARKSMGRNTEIQLIQDGKIIDRKKISIKSNNQKDIVRFYPQAKKSGLQRYQLRLKALANEVNVHNNSASIYVDVIDSKKKILILYDSPHPDISAIKSALIGYETYDVEAIQLNKFHKNIKAYNLVILHQLPNASRSSLQLIQSLKIERIPYLLIMGENTNLPNFNSLHSGVEIQNRSMNMNTVTAIYDNRFSGFTLSNDLKLMVNNLPPLSSPYGKYRVSKAMQSIFNQQIGAVQTKIPLVSIHNQSGWRTAFILGEGIWRWRIYDYMLNSNHIAFNELIVKIVRYLSLIKKQSNFDIEVKRHFNESEDIVFTAVVYNDSYEPIVENEINLIIRNENNQEYKYSFSKLDSSYLLNAGMLPAGVYNYTAKVIRAGEKLLRKGSFIVKESQLEALNLKANHHLLHLIANEHTALVFEKGKMIRIADEISKRNDIVNIEYNQLKYQDLIDVKWLTFFVLLLLMVEWFVRKQSGSY